jgi:16S rRNA (uracil1498-N3)-methyltransferase
VPLTLVQAALKTEKMDDVVRDAVMLGVASIQPIVTRRTEVTFSALARAHRRDRWVRIAVSAAKQCGRAVVPEVEEPVTIEALADAVTSLHVPSPALMLVEPSASATVRALGEIERTPPREASILIGPEGGWDSLEIERLSVACQLVTLGGRTLRADAMALVAISALFAHWREF